MSLRRRIASILLLVTVVFVVTRFLGHREELVPATLVVELGESRVIQLTATFMHADTSDPAAMFMRRDATGSLRHETRLAPGLYDVFFELTTEEGTRRAQRTVEVSRDAIITVDLREASPQTSGLRPPASGHELAQLFIQVTQGIHQALQSTNHGMVTLLNVSAWLIRQQAKAICQADKIAFFRRGAQGASVT